MESAPPRQQQPGVHACTFPLRIIISAHEGTKGQSCYLKCDASLAWRPRLRGQGTSATLVQIINITQTRKDFTDSALMSVCFSHCQHCDSMNLYPIQFWQMSKFHQTFDAVWHADAQGRHLMMMEHKQNYRFISWRSLRHVMIHFPPLHLIKLLVIDIWIVPVWPRPQKAVNMFFSLLDWSVGNNVINRRVSSCLYKICFNKWGGCGIWRTLHW